MKDSEDRFRSLVENAKDMIFRMSLPDGAYEYVSPASNDVFGYTQQEFYANPTLIRQIVHPEWLDYFEREWANLAHGEIPESCEYQIVHKSGDLRWVLQRSVLLRSDLGQPVAVEGMIADITARKGSEEAIRESERRYRLLAENTLDSSWQMDLDLRFTYVNHAVARLMGYSVNEWIGLKLHDVCDEENFQKMFDVIATELAKGPAGKGAVFEAMLLKKTGEPIHVEIHGKVVLDENGCPVALQGITRDITERKRNEEALRESEEKFRALSDATFEAIFLSEKGVCIGQNLSAAKMFGYSAEEALERSTIDWIAPEVREVVSDHMLSEDGEPYETIALRKDGTTFPCEIQGKMIHHGDRTIRVTALRDITDRKKASELLIQAERRRAISGLTSGVAHNFKNWLQVIVGATRLALQDVEEQDYRELKIALEKTMKAAQSGAATLKRLEQFAEIREGASESGDKILDVSGTLRSAVEMTKPWWKTGPQEQGITIVLKSNLTSGAWVRGREVELFEVFVNLIGNASEAIKEDGEIEVESSIEGDKVIIRIGDTGTGIAPQNLNKIFEPFWTTKPQVGTGLGLPSSLTIVKKHRGTISAESQVGSGSIFTVTLPLAQPPEEPATEGHRSAVRTGLKVLVIDDMESAAELLQIQLTRLGYQAVVALSGDEALQCFSASDFDLVICDLVMPEMSGWEVGKALKETCERRGVSKTPFILLTGIGEALLEESRIADSGIDVVTEKPLDTKELVAIIQEVLPGA